MSKYEYRAIVRGVHDGDTITVDVDLGWKTWRHDEPLRLAGIDAPELATAAGRLSQARLAHLLPLGSEVIVQTTKDKTEKYGRMLAVVSPAVAPTYTVNDALVNTGHAKRWDGKGPRP